MKHHSYQTRDVYAEQVSFEFGGKRLHNVIFHGGCPGNTFTISKLPEDRDAAEVVPSPRGSDCDGRGTPCADQLAITVEEALQQVGVISSSE